MSSSPAIEPDVPDLVCQLNNLQGMIHALTCVRWKRHQDALVELSEHGIVLIVEESGCLQAKVYLQRELFTKYEYRAEGRSRFGISLGLLVDCLNTFSTPAHSNTIEIKYPGPYMELLLKSVDTLNSCIYSEIRTRIPRSSECDYNFEQAKCATYFYRKGYILYSKLYRRLLDTHTLYSQLSQMIVLLMYQSSALKEAIDDLEWPGSSVQIILQKSPPCVTFRGDRHGDLQIDFMYYTNTDLLLAFHCDTEVSYGYKYKFLKATTTNIPGNVVRENSGSKLTIGRGGMLKVQNLLSVAKA